ncbi:MAG: DUF2953 domain-containing protein [Ruminococcaceae bacterium]|nr:DUF2953 domain-containing protein [Oscillospiraceae bacterium]
MIAVIIIILVLFALAVIWLSINIQMELTGLNIWIKIMFFKVQVYPRPKASTAKTKKKTEKPAETEEKPRKPKEKMDYKGFARILLKAAGRIRRKLGINRLKFHYTAGGPDPADTALQYGRVSAAVYSLMPEVCRIFNVKHKDVSVSVDFDIEKPTVELDLSMGMYLWQIIYIGIFTLADFSKLKSNN